MSNPQDQLKYLGDALIEFHDWLREELSQLRGHVNNLANGSSLSDVGIGDKDQFVVELRRHCLSFCHGLHTHHTGEDIGAFPALREHFPDLAPVLDKLSAEHQVVASLQEEIQGLIADYDVEHDDPRILRDRVERLAALLEGHFEQEEQHLVSALNSMEPVLLPE